MKTARAVMAAVFGFLLVSVALLSLIAVVLGSGQPAPALVGVSSFAVLCLLPGMLLIRSSGRSLRFARVSQIGLAVVLVASIAVLGGLNHRGLFERSKVRLSNGVLLIQGRLDRELLAEFRRVLQTADLRDVRVRLRSPGGDTYTGMAIGREIHRRHLDVEVDRRCISSCANYLFTAGRNKYLKSADHVQFHGSKLQPDIVASALALIEQGRQMLAGEDVPPDLDQQQLRELYGLANDFPFNFATGILAEKAFFDEIGVSSLTPVYGQYGDYAAWFKDGIHDNFSYLPKDYALLNVTNVIVSGSDSDSRFSPSVFRASTTIPGVNALQAQMDEVYRRIEAAVPFGVGEIWRSQDAPPNP
jgi:hypothetical protein